MPAGSRQLEIDWSRGRQLAILRDCVLPRGLRADHGEAVSCAMAKLVLKMIDDFGRGSGAYVSLGKLSEVCGVSTKTITRATQALELLSVLCVEHDGRRNCNRYTVVWSELALLCPENSPSCNSPASQAEEHVSTMAGKVSGTVQRTASASSQRVSRVTQDGIRKPRDACPIGPDRKDIVSDRKDIVSERKDTYVPLTDIETAKEPPPPYPPTCSEPANAAEPVSWGSAAAEIRAYGVQRTTDAIRYAKLRGVRPEDVLDALRTCRANERLFGRPQAALVDWCRSGEWPADGVQDWQTVESLRQRTAQRRASAGHHSTCMDAWRAVRDRTPRGEIVDDWAVVEEAVRRHVPREVALRFAGLEVGV